MAPSRTASDAVRIEGLAGLQRVARTAGPQFTKQLRLANKAAAESVARIAVQRATGLGGVAARAARTLRARGEQRYAKLSLGSKQQPEALGANFGAYHDRVRNTARGIQVGWNQFAEFGGNQFTGGASDLFLYWSISRASRSGELLEHYERELDALLDRLAHEQ